MDTLSLGKNYLTSGLSRQVGSELHQLLKRRRLLWLLQYEKELCVFIETTTTLSIIYRTKKNINSFDFNYSYKLLYNY